MANTKSTITDPTLFEPYTITLQVRTGRLQDDLRAFQMGAQTIAPQSPPTADGNATPSPTMGPGASPATWPDTPEEFATAYLQALFERAVVEGSGTIARLDATNVANTEYRKRYQK